jgi:hypothetical protein
VRDRPRSLYRLDQTLSTAAWSPRQASRTPAERSAATATERASFGSFLFVFPAASSRTRAASLGWTSSTRSPAASSCWASRCPVPPAPSTAQVRSGHAAAQASSRCSWPALARTRSSPSRSSAALTAAAVCEPLCGSTPIITTAMASFPSPQGAGTVAGMPHSRTVASARASLEPRHGEAPAGRHVVNKPGHTRGWPAGGSRASPTGTSQRYETRLTAIPARSVASIYNEADVRVITRLTMWRCVRSVHAEPGSCSVLGPDTAW